MPVTILSFTEAELITAFLVFVRTVTFLSTNPLFGNSSVPVRIRLIFSAFLALLFIPVVPATPGLTSGLFEMSARIVHEAFIGASMGFLVTLMFTVIAIAGHMISSTAGLQMASMFDPSLQTSNTVLGTLKSIVMFLVFVSMDLHHVLIEALAWSFVKLPPGAGFGGARAGFYLVQLFTTVLKVGFTVSLPVLLVVFMINLAMAIIARIAPQMNVFFAIGGSINEQALLLLVAVSLPAITSTMSGLLSGVGDRLLELIRQFT